jgi:hypothetical protein
MPPRLEVINNGWDLEWLAAHPDMLFPRTAKIAGMWFKEIQWRAQRLYWKRHKLDVLVTGRRKIDGNFVGSDIDGRPWYISHSQGDLLRYSPLAEWSHEDVLACLYYRGCVSSLPPFYKWPRGYRCGTHAWAARQWCPTIQSGWAEVFQIEPELVRDAAPYLESAKQFLETL